MGNRLLVATILALIGCKNHTPPPIELGKCLVDKYEGASAKKQSCDYGGYRWVCSRDGDTDSCDRAGEAAGERVPVVPPPPVAPVPADASGGAK